MTKNYIEIVKRSPYYSQVDGSIIVDRIPVDTNKKMDVWEAWKKNLPDYCEKEKVFLDLVHLEHKNQLSFIETMSRMITKLDNEFLKLMETKQEPIDLLYANMVNHLIIPSKENWEMIKKHLLQDDGTKTTETLPQFFLRVALQNYRDDWTATSICFQNLLMGKILLGIEPHRKYKCFIQGTPVWTLDGVKPIEEIGIGDQVATHNGRFCPVLQTFKNNIDDRHLYTIYSTHGKVATTTHDHPFLVYNTTYQKILWRNAIDLTQNDYLLYNSLAPLPDLNTDNSATLLKGGDWKSTWRWVLETNQRYLVSKWWQNKTMWFTDKEEAEMVMMVLNLFNYNVVVMASRHGQWYVCERVGKHIDKDILTISNKKFVGFSHRQRHVHHDHLLCYTLHVENDNSYTVNGYVVKNCMGVTPTSMVLTKNTMVPISILKQGDYVLDKGGNSIRVNNIIKNHYEGMIFGCCTAATTIYMQNGATQTMMALDDPNERMVPEIGCYYDPVIDKKFSMNQMNFLLKYFCDWQHYEQKTDWISWTTTISDRFIITPILQESFHPFQYRFHGTDICIQKEVLLTFLDKSLNDLLHVSTDKLYYFFSFLDRRGKNIMTTTQSRWCSNLRSLLRGTIEDVSWEKPYKGDIYNLDIEGDGYCVLLAVIQKPYCVGIDERHLEKASHLCITDQFFHEITRQPDNLIWQEITRSQIKYGRPSLVCVDRDNNECVSGDTRILTRHGIVPISSKKDEIVSVWNGTQFTNVVVAQTGIEKQFLRIHFSNGLSLTCTPHHKFFLIKGSQNVYKVSASNVKCGDEIAPFQLPPISTMTILPSTIIMTLEWISKRCIHIENNVVLFDRDVESLKDILLDLQYCGLKSEIIFHSSRNEYELRINKTRWNLLNYRHLNKNNCHMEGDMVENIKIVTIEHIPKHQVSYCFHEPFAGTSIFEGVATGQCENLSDILCVQGVVNICRFLQPNPWIDQISSHNITVYTTKDCPFSRLLQMDFSSLQIRDIKTHRVEWQMRRNTHALSTLPAIFLNNQYVGNFMDFWKKYACPVLNTNDLYQCVFSLVQALDNTIDNQPDRAVYEFFQVMNRPILLKINGFREMLLRMRLPLDEAHDLNHLVFETIHQAALKASNDLACRKGSCDGSSQLVASLENTFKTPSYRDLWQSIQQNGLRNMISIMSEPENNVLYYDWVRQDVCAIIGENSTLFSLQNNENIPNSLKKIYQNEFEVSQQHRLKLMIDRKNYGVINDTFHLYVHSDMKEQELSWVQKQAWSEFNAIHIHHQENK